MAWQGHINVDIPMGLQAEVGSLLECFERTVQEKGYQSWRVEKELGNHITPWWLYIQMHQGGDSKKTVVQVGETIFKKVNPIPHLWVRGKQEVAREAERLLRNFLTQEVDQKRSLAVADFNGTEFGEEYLSFKAGERVSTLPIPEGEDSQGWQYGVLSSGKKGWFPPEYVTEASSAGSDV